MPVNDASECKKIAEAFEKATKVFDPNTTLLLRSLLEERCGLKIGSPPCSTLEEIEAAMTEIAGTGADLLISRMRSFMR